MSVKATSMRPSRFVVIRKTGYHSPYNARMLWAGAKGRALDLGKPQDVRPACFRLGSTYFQVPAWILDSLFRWISNYRTVDGRIIR